MKEKRLIHPFLLLLVFLSACKSFYPPTAVEYAGYRVTKELPIDSSVQRLLQPYRDSVNSSMNHVVGIADASLEKGQPQGSLGSFMADAMFYAAQQKFGIPVDAAFVNPGGIRINQLPAGAVSRGKIFELMPFDNLVVLQKMTGATLQEFLDLTAAKRGWPVAGLTMKIRNGKAVDVLVGGAPLDVQKIYTIVNSDYVANGGDDAEMLRRIPQENKGYLMRDAIFDYINILKAKGKNISVTNEKRVINAE